MKYLKLYSEKFNLFNWRKKKTDKDIYQQSFDIKEFCEDYLSYLLDKDYELSIENLFDRHTKRNQFRLYMSNSNTHNTWGYVKDNFLPFLEIFIKEYEIDGNVNIWISTDDISKPPNIEIHTTAANLLKDDDTISSSYMVRNINFNIK